MGGAWRVRIITPLSGEGPLRPCKVRYAGNESGNATGKVRVYKKGGHRIGNARCAVSRCRI